MDDDFALGGPSVLLGGDPILLQLGPPLFAILSDLPGVVRWMIVADFEVRAGGLPLATGDFDLGRLGAWLLDGDILIGPEQGQRARDPQHPDLQHSKEKWCGAALSQFMC